MSRTTVTASELQTIAQTRVNNIPKIRQDFAKIIVGAPLRHGPDENGCNWSISYDGEGMYSQAIGVAVHELQQLYNLE